MVAIVTDYMELVVDASYVKTDTPKDCGCGVKKGNMGTITNEVAANLRNLARYIKLHSYQEGDFLLSCGKRSPYVVDLSLSLRRPYGLRLLSTIIGSYLPEHFHAIGGPSSGADPIAAAVALQKNVAWFSIRKEPKKHGFDTGKITGPVSPGDRVVIVEDVLTSGKSLCSAIEAAKDAGLEIARAIVVVDRCEFDAFDRTRQLLHMLGHNHAELYTMLTIDDLKQVKGDSNVERTT